MSRRLLDAIVVTRDGTDTPSWMAGLREFAHQVLGVPCVARKLLPPTPELRAALRQSLASAPPSDIAFASRHGVLGFSTWLAAAEVVLPETVRLSAVGPATAAATATAFGRCQPIQAPFTGLALGHRLRQQQPPPASVWLPGAQHARDDLRRVLEAASVPCRVMPVYVTRAGVLPDTPRPPLGPRCVVVFASPSAVMGFFSHYNSLDGALALALGPATAEALRKFAVARIALAPEASWSGVLRWFGAQRL